MIIFVAGIFYKNISQSTNIQKKITTYTMKYLSRLGLVTLILTMLSIVGCEKEKPTYEGKNFIHFAHTNHTFGILDSEEWFEIPVEASHAVEQNINIGVEVIFAESSAIEDKHFVMESHTLSLKPGKQSTMVRIKGIAESLTANTPVDIKLRLVVDDENIESKSSIETVVTLQQCCPFDINNFSGYAVLTSTWAMSYMNSDSRLVHTHVDENEDGVIVIEDMFYEDYDICVKLHSDDRLNPLASLYGPQVLSDTGEAFGTIYGNGKLMVDSPMGSVSYYSTCENFLLLYSVMYVEEVGTVGEFLNILEWISDDEAERIMREGF